MSEQTDQPESDTPTASATTPTVDPDVDRAPGGADAALSESDVGAVSRTEAITPDQPLSAQQEDDAVPDEIQEPEPADEPGDDEAQAAEPSD